MPAAPSPQTWVDGNIPTYLDMNRELYYTWYFLLNPPMVKVRQITTQAIGHQTWTAIQFDAEDVDTMAAHSLTVNKERITPKVPGYYVGYSGASFGGNTTGRRLVATRKNGNVLRNSRADSLPSSNASHPLVIKGVAFGPVYMNGTTDYFTTVAYQSSGGTLYTNVGSGTTDYEEQPEFYCRWWSS